MYPAFICAINLLEIKRIDIEVVCCFPGLLGVPYTFLSCLGLMAKEWSHFSSLWDLKHLKVVKRSSMDM